MAWGVLPGAAALAGLPITSPSLPLPITPASGEPLSLPSDTISDTLPLGMLLGEALPPVPQKLVEKVRKWQYVDMAELLPDLWAIPKATSNTAAQKNHLAHRKQLTTNFTKWLQCYSSYVSALGSADPAAVPELMAHMSAVVRMHQEFGELTWWTYDVAFWRQAAVTRNRKWSKLNLSLYGFATAGKARVTSRCDLCLGAGHTAAECSILEDPDPDAGMRIKSLETAILALVAQRTSSPTPSQVRRNEPCFKWNAGRCTFRRCRYQHRCHVCSGQHQAVRCPDSARPMFNRDRQSASSDTGPPKETFQFQAQMNAAHPYKRY